MSVMIGSVTERLAPDSDFMMWSNDTNGSIIDTVARDHERVKIAAAVTFLSGIFQVCPFCVQELELWGLKGSYSNSLL